MLRQQLRDGALGATGRPMASTGTDPTAEWPPEMRDALAALRIPPTRATLPRTARGPAEGPERARHARPPPGADTAYHTFNGHILFGTTLSPRQRELLVLRVAAVRDCDYEWAQHVVLAGDVGLDARRGRPHPRGPRRAGLVAARRGAAARGRRAHRATPRIADATWAALSDELDEQQLMDVVFTVGRLRLLAMALRSFGVELDDDLGRGNADASDPETRFSSGDRVLSSQPTYPTGGATDMAHFPKPAEGSWTEHYPELGTGPVSYEDSISPEHYELERDAIFRRTWLNVGRVEQLPRNGSYFTKELDAARTSVVVVRGTDGEVRAFHNICRHRGNKLVWNDFPREETSGTCRQFTCKYHGWRYDLDGELTFVQQEEEFFDLDKADYGLAPVQCRGVGGVHLREPRPRQHHVAARLPGRARRRARGLPVRRDDPGAQVPRRGRQQLEALHRRLRRVLPRTGPAREAGGRRGVAQARRATASRRSRTTSTARTAWSRRGAAWRRRRT